MSENGRPQITLELSLNEAHALKAWLLKASADGVAAIDDEELKPALVKLGSVLDYFEGVITVRRELEEAGFATDQLSDEQVAELGRRIAETPLRRYAHAH